jgi:putative nucleotidyltransferase with HDIG domain
MFEALPIDRAIAAALPEGTLFAVGGRVRDELRRGLENAPIALKDLDYVVTGISHDDLARRLRTLGRVDLVGASFSVFKVTVDGRTVDVALPRRERSTGAGHRDFEVESGPEIALEDDLARRDFRMNMIARAIPSGELVDPYDGEADIRAKRIDILTPQTFVEDPLRMLRAAQFAARFGYELTPRTRDAMRDAAPLANTISAERIAEEFTKLFVQAKKPSIGIELLRETGVLEHVWPELLEGIGVEQNEWHKYPVYRHNLETLDAVPPGDLILRLSALLHDVGKPRTKDGPHFYRHEHVGADMARTMLARLRFSTEVTETAEHLVRQHMYSADPDLSDAAIRRFIRRIGVAHLDRQFALRAADIAGSGLPKRDDSNERFQARVYAEVARKPPFSIKDLAFDGSDVIAMMVKKGLAAPGFRGDKRVGDALQYLFEQVTEQPGRNEPGTLAALLEQYFGGS